MVAASHSSDAKTVEEEDLAQTERDHITPKRNNADALSINDVWHNLRTTQIQHHQEDAIQNEEVGL